jgi:hypothetical protein
LQATGEELKEKKEEKIKKREEVMKEKKQRPMKGRKGHYINPNQNYLA